MIVISIVILFFSIFQSINAAFSNPTYSYTSSLQCSTFNLFLTNPFPVANPATYSTSFTTSFSTTPSAALGLIMIDTANPTSSDLGFIISIGSINTAGISISFQTYNSTQFNSVGISIFATVGIASVYYINQPMSIINSGNGLRTESYLTLFDPNNFYNSNSDTIYFLPFLSGVIMNKGTSDNFELILTTQIYNETYYRTNFKTEGNTIVYRACYFLIFYDLSQIQISQSIFYDTNYVIATSSGYNLLSFAHQNINNFHAGINSFNFTFSNGYSFTFYRQNFTLTNNTPYTFLNFSTFSYRQRTCPAAQSFYHLPSDLCYDICPNYYYNYYTSTFCKACYYYCLTCSDYQNESCITCDSQRTFNFIQYQILTPLGTCNCNPGTYDDGINNLCIACDYSCSTCTGNLPMNCTSCNLTFYRILNMTFCNCLPGYYDNGVAACSVCSILNCAICKSATICSGCSAGFYLESTNTTCLNCNLTFSNCLYCNSNSCTTCVANFYLYNNSVCNSNGVCSYGFYFNNKKICIQICGDGILFNLPCDDGNVINGDGCSSICTVQKDYTCYNGSSNSHSICSFDIPFKFSVTSQIQSPYENLLQIKLSIKPVVLFLSTINFSQTFNVNLSSSKVQYQYDNKGNLQIDIYYSTNIYLQNASITFNPPNSSEFLYTPNSTVSFIVSSINNIGSYYYSDTVYAYSNMNRLALKALFYLSLISFVASFFISKLIGIQMMRVLQVAMLSLMMIKNIQSPLAPFLQQLEYINGYNGLYYSNKNSVIENVVPIRISSLNYEASIVYNINFMGIIIISPFLIASCIFITLILVDKQKIQELKQKILYLKKIGWIILSQYLFAIILFFLYQIMVSIVLFLIYTKITGTNIFMIDAMMCIFLLGILAFVFLMYFYRPEDFKQFKTEFQTEHQNYYFGVVIQIILFAISLVAGNEFRYIGIILFLILCGNPIYVVIKRPYSYKYNNYRVIFNSIIMILIVSMNLTYKISENYECNPNDLSYKFPAIQIALLYLTWFLNTGILIKYQLDKNKLKQNDKEKQQMINNTECEIPNNNPHNQEHLEHNQEEMMSYCNEGQMKKIVVKRKSFSQVSDNDYQLNNNFNNENVQIIYATQQLEDKKELKIIKQKKNQYQIDQLIKFNQNQQDRSKKKKQKQSTNRSDMIPDIVQEVVQYSENHDVQY